MNPADSRTWSRSALLASGRSVSCFYFVRITIEKGARERGSYHPVPHVHPHGPRGKLDIEYGMVETVEVFPPGEEGRYWG